MIGMLAIAKAGHDKDNVYLIIDEDQEYVYLVDGVYRTIQKPKKKNKRHIQIIKKNEYDSMKSFIQTQSITNEMIKREIKLYCKKIK